MSGPQRARTTRAPRSALRTAVVGAVVVCSVGALAGCTASGGGTGGAAPTSFRVAAIGAGSLETLDPTKMDGQASIARAYQVFEPLVRMGSGEDVVENVLAEELTPNADGTVWTLKLRSGVTWHDGTPLTVDDVIYTMNYNVDNATFGRAVWATVDRAGLTRIDDLTLDIPLISANFLFPEQLVDVNELIIRNGTTDFQQPIGTGPFRFESFTPGQVARFERNSDYWGDAPELESVEILSIDDDSARVNALVSGQVDAIAGVPATGVAQLDAAGLPVGDEPSGQWVGLRMNTTMTPFDVPEVRQAMRLLVDRQQIVDNAYGGSATIGNDLFGWFDPDYADLEQHSYDPEAARTLLEGAGYPDLAFTLPTTGLDAGTNEMATLFAGSAAAAGVTVTVEQKPVAEFYSSLPDAAIAPTSWAARTVATQMNHQMSRQALEGGLSEGAWSDDRFLSAYEAAIGSSDPAQQREHLLEAQTLAHEDGPYIIPAFSNIVTATSDRVSGTATNMRLAFGDYDFTDVTLD